MFHFEPNLHRIAVRPSSMVWLAASSNQPNVAVPGRQMQAAQAFALALRRDGGRIALYVAIWLTIDRMPAFFVHERTALPMAALDGAIEEAREFCESMGFILDVVPLDEGASPDLDRILARLRGEEEAADARLGGEPPGVLATPGPMGAPQAIEPSPDELDRIGRLLASF